MFSHILRYGLLFGIALGIGFFVSYLIFGNDPNNFSKGEVVGYSVMIISAVAVVYGIKDYKENVNNGELSFLSGFGIGAGISAIAGLIFGLYMMIYLKWLNPTFTETYMKYSEEQIRMSGVSDEVMQAQLGELATYSDMMSNDLLQSAVMFATVFMIGLLFSLVSAAAMKTNAPNN